MAKLKIRPEQSYQSQRSHLQESIASRSSQPTESVSAAEPEAGFCNIWIALLVWLAAFLGMSINLWFDFFKGLFEA